MAGKDPAAILAFVSDSIATTSGEDYGLFRSPTDTRWGPRGVLRSGAGTMRDKAQLLADLYTQAGFAAKVVTGPVADPLAFSKAALQRSITRVFDPQADAATLATWRKVLAAPDTPVAQHWSADLTQIHQLAQTLTSAMPAGWKGREYAAMWGWGMDEVPLVQVTIAGKATYANPNVPGAVLGQSYTTMTRSDAPGPKPFDSVKITLSMCPLGTPSKRVTLAQTSYTVDQIIGRQVALSFAPMTNSGTLLDTDPNTVQTFAPTIALQGVDMTPEQIKDTAVIGGVLTLAGDFATVDTSGVVQVNGQPFVALAGGDPAIAARIASLAMNLQASSFPQIRVQVTARDAAGMVVPGLSGSSLSLTEESQKIPFTLVSNQGPPPRVLFLIDASDSIPSEFGSPNSGAAARQIAQQVLAIDPRAQFASDVIASPMSAYTPNLDDLETWINRSWVFGSPLWAGLAMAADYRPTAIVFLTDGAPEAPPTTDELARISSGPPVLMLGVGNTDLATLQRMADVGHGKLFLPSQQSEVVTAVVGYLAAVSDISYELHYEAPMQGPSMRHVNLAVTGSPVTAAGTYTVPAVADQIPAPVVGALFVTIDYQGKQVTRRVAGRETLSEGMTAAAVEDELRYAMLGALAISFEGEAPSVSQWLDDIITARLTLEPLWKAQQAADHEALAAALANGYMSIPSELPSLHAALAPSAAGEPLTFNNGLRAVLLQSRYLPATKQVERRADLLPFMRYVTADTDSRAAVVQTLEKTLLLSVAESALYQQSTEKLLKGKTLSNVGGSNIFWAVPPVTVPTGLGDRWNAAMGPYSANNNLVPTDGSPIAFWSVDGTSGTVVGVVEDIGGSGLSTSARVSFQGSLELLSAAGILGDLAGFGFTFGAGLALGGAYIKQIRRATIAIATMEDWTAANNDHWPAVCGFGCDLLRGAVAAGLQGTAVLSVPTLTGPLAVDMTQTVARMDAWYGLARRGDGDGYGCGCPNDPTSSPPPP